jgi:hypothetical protein
MTIPYLRPALVAAAALGLTGCAGNGYNHHYGYAGLSYGYASPYYGWYDDYYYPGTGYYVYERSGARHRWNDSQRHYWETHRGNHGGSANWSGYHRDHDGNRGNWNGDRHDRGNTSGNHHSHDHDGNHHSHGHDGDHDRSDGDHHRR